ncbi:hypothetical protein SERLA73DRAFT_189809 [Serpula lacrymans var. lacrymans S7.3]|uniref:CRA domain-containing protein n=2 Tax=Serpula lacrymans var. lacrymans TaxID=341189 RepID=F8QEL1_SERL3|nr:uncharacterized protein SERLADRAFT_480922 [Serpula lacrymans var. lacrymans S7.9]EGN93267.1 hypothetical protein SERLA73DRAFT_189809 [Serpula lacrymans var. lacrymans S7.3]EGO18650.1 hypothetical protein SERLADRAFT_480922 [Serpula lacrymans var. lacrymans S7.9]
MDNSKFSDPRPDDLRALVLQYLCHNCYTSTARAFARDSAVRHLDADGNEITSSRAKEMSPDLSEGTLNNIKFRNDIRLCILSGQVDEAITLLNKHFPNVLDLSEVETRMPGQNESASKRAEYVLPNTVHPAHLSLNLHILAFIEACRTIPLLYTPPEPSSKMAFESVPKVTDTTNVAEDDEQHQMDLLSRAQKLNTEAGRLEKSTDQDLYLKELENVVGLLAYKDPERSPMSKYMSQERRGRVADQIDGAILFHTNHPPISRLEFGVRFTHTLWAILHDLQVKAPPSSSRPTGLRLPPVSQSSTSPSEQQTGTAKEPTEYLPAFDLKLFLDIKT